MWLRLVTVGLVGTALCSTSASNGGRFIGRPNVLVIAVVLSFSVRDFLFVRNVVKL